MILASTVIEAREGTCQFAPAKSHFGSRYEGTFVLDGTSDIARYMTKIVCMEERARRPQRVSQSVSMVSRPVRGNLGRDVVSFSSLSESSRPE